MKVVRIVVCLLMLFISSTMILNTNSAFAKQKEEKVSQKEEIVYVTKSGKKYHKEGCPFIKNRETVSVSKEEAENKGLKPCGRCNKEEE